MSSSYQPCVANPDSLLLAVAQRVDALAEFAESQMHQLGYLPGEGPQQGEIAGEEHEERANVAAEEANGMYEEDRDNVHLRNMDDLVATAAEVNALLWGLFGGRAL